MNNFNIKVFKNGSIAEGAQIASSARLFVSGWTLCRLLKHAKQNKPKDWVIVIGYIDNQPISVVLCEAHGQAGLFVSAFTKKNYRGNGYASMLLNFLFDDIDKNKVTAAVGLDRTCSFWRKHNITITQ